ncbi:MAG: putative glycolipid-binding domain-containing protein [Chloroflexota bacterium]|nr:putative glycolipid-binding domain-containing protein [Chloroflexota bacterium]
MEQVERAVLWRSLNGPGCEYCVFGRAGDGWQIEGTVLLASDDRPLEVRYRVECDDRWSTRAVDIEMRAGPERRALQLRADDRGRWWRDGEELPAVRGCPDIDLSVTPATNTLPIRRLGLTEGAGAAVTAAWVRFPALTIEPLPQRYTRLARDRYRYESATGYTTEIETDGLGLVTRYAGGWERVAEG